MPASDFYTRLPKALEKLYDHNSGLSSVEHELYACSKVLKVTAKDSDWNPLTLTMQLVDNTFYLTMNVPRVNDDECLMPQSFEGAQMFLKDLIGYYIIMKGIFFYSAFAMILSLHRQNK